MIPWQAADIRQLSDVGFVLTDVDDTLTHKGKLEAPVLVAMQRLRSRGFKVIPVTAASAGWGSMMASMWPVDAVIAENGGVAFVPDSKGWQLTTFAAPNRTALAELDERLRRQFPALRRSQDAAFRLTGLAYDRLPSPEANAALLSVLSELGAAGTLNSMWLLAWLGSWDKLAMATRVLEDQFALTSQAFKSRVLYVGDSENDEVMFRALPLSAGVSTVRLHPIRYRPAWITEGPGGAGFIEIAERLLDAKERLKSAPNSTTTASSP